MPIRISETSHSTSDQSITFHAKEFIQKQADNVPWLPVRTLIKLTFFGCSPQMASHRMNEGQRYPTERTLHVSSASTILPGLYSASYLF